jgi:hypothetical protein
LCSFSTNPKTWCPTICSGCASSTLSTNTAVSQMGEIYYS